MRKKVKRMKLIDKDALIEEVGVAEDCKGCRRSGLFGCGEDSSFAYACDCITDAPIIVEFEGDINKVIVKGEEYYKQLTTTWIGNYSPYTCKHCGFHVDSKTRYCPDCGRMASNYD
jgi:hypothetical protein